jgi:hypothetical protein
MKKGSTIGIRIVQRVNFTFGFIVAKALGQWTQANMSTMQSLCLIALLFIAAIQLNTKLAQPKLIRLICLVYCNQQLRRLFISGADTSYTLLPNIMLACAIAVLLIYTTNKDDTSSLADLRMMLEGLMYMYGDILDFTFAYGILPITAMAFGAGQFLSYSSKPTDPMLAFMMRLATIVSTNVIYQGVTTIINSPVQAKLIESIASISVLRLLLPSMESYLTYMTAAYLANLIPGIAPIIMCTIIWTDLLPTSSQGWVSELFTIYVITAIINYIINISTWGAVVVLILAHYIDHIIAHID